MSSVAPLRDEWLAAMHSQTDIEIDCAAVENFSAAGAQLLASLSALMKITGGNLHLKNIPASLQEDLTLLGLPQYLQELTSHG